VEWVRAFRKAADAGLGGGFPVFMWFWDPIDYGEQRRMWFEGVAPLFDLVFLNERRLYSCFTHALLVLYSSCTRGLLVQVFLNEKGREAMWACHVKARAASTALRMLFSCVTRALLVLYSCFTRALLMQANVHYIEEGVMVEGNRCTLDAFSSDCLLDAFSSDFLLKRMRLHTQLNKGTQWSRARWTQEAASCVHRPTKLPAPASYRRQPPTYVSSYSYICVLILLYMHPHTPIYVSPHSHMCPHTTTEAQGGGQLSYRRQPPARA
jgi:hypothetical protein